MISGNLGRRKALERAMDEALKKPKTNRRKADEVVGLHELSFKRHR